jgi:hypothetical protein
MNRNQFFARRTDYLFSFDLDLFKGREPSIKDEPDAMSSKTVCSEPDPNEPLPPPTVYHALGESHVLGEPVVQGHIVLTQERIEFFPGEDFGEITGRVVLRTLDDVLIEGSYHGVLRARQRWPVLWRQAGPGSEDAVTIETRAHISAHFETGSIKYAWLPQHQCIGYGKLKLKGGEAEHASFDVYALGA